MVQQDSQDPEEEIQEEEVIEPDDDQSDDENAIEIREWMENFEGVKKEEIQQTITDLLAALEKDKKAHPKRRRYMLKIADNKIPFVFRTGSFDDTISFGLMVDKLKSAGKVSTQAAMFIQKHVIFPRLSTDEIRQGSHRVHDGDSVKLFQNILQHSGVNDEYEIKNL